MHKIVLAIRIWALAGLAWWRMKREPLPELVMSWSTTSTTSDSRSPHRVSHVVDRVLSIGRWQPRCIIRALIVYRLVSERGYKPNLVIGMPIESDTKDTHAWVELAGKDMGPWPGRGDLESLVAFDENGAR